MFDPDLFWRFAEKLLKDTTVDECQCRTAAGRAYYAFFLTVRDRFETRENIRFSHSAADHSYVVRLLKERNRDNVAQALSQLLRLREEADYEMGPAVDVFRVSLALDKARSQYTNAKKL